MTLKFHYDPGHGWLEVTLGDLQLTGLKPEDFSIYSYRGRNGEFYLEEDCDAPKFLNQLMRMNGGHKPPLKEVGHGYNCFIRNLPCIHERMPATH